MITSVKRKTICHPSRRNVFFSIAFVLQGTIVTLDHFLFPFSINMHIVHWNCRKRALNVFFLFVFCFFKWTNKTLLPHFLLQMLLLCLFKGSSKMSGWELRPFGSPIVLSGLITSHLNSHDAQTKTSTLDRAMAISELLTGHLLYFTVLYYWREYGILQDS